VHSLQVCTSLRVTLESFGDFPCRNSDIHRETLDVVRHDRTGSDNRTVTDLHTAQYHRTGTYPYICSNFDRIAGTRLTVPHPRRREHRNTTSLIAWSSRPTM